MADYGAGDPGSCSFRFISDEATACERELSQCNSSRVGVVPVNNGGGPRNLVKVDI